MTGVIVVGDGKAVRKILVHTLEHAGASVLDADYPNKALLLVSSTPECMASSAPG
jgi:CheY-like chemotaxis protein